MDGSYNKRRSGGAKIYGRRALPLAVAISPLILRPSGDSGAVRPPRESKVAAPLPKPLLMTIRRYFQITVITRRAPARRENAIPTIAVGGSGGG